MNLCIHKSMYVRVLFFDACIMLSCPEQISCMQAFLYFLTHIKLL
jgi:hypothetical protein